MRIKKHNKSGFTLIEIIIAIALIGIISIGIIPAFAAQFKMTVDTKNITTQSFDAQGGFEQIINELKNALADPVIDELAIADVSKESKTLFGRNVDMHKLFKIFPGNENKNFLVFLSKRLAVMEIRQLLVAEGVSIEISNETIHQIADLKKTPKRTLIGKYATNADPNWYANIFKWYYSDVGNPNPVFPDDYERVILPGVTPATLDSLSKYANRYIVFTVTPVDIHGVRGNEVRSSNTVYILGKEWREGLFAWIDKDEDISYVANTDIIISKGNSWKWHLLDGFDTSNTFLDPTNPDKTLDPKDGSLYVPMSIDRSPAQRVGIIGVSGSDAIEWTVDKSINLATDITVTNSTDINMKTRDGDIIFYQYLKLNSSGDAEYETNGMPKLINYGPNVSTGGDIHLGTAGRGDVILQNYTKLTAGDNIVVDPFGRTNISKGTITAGKSITLDTTKGSSFPGNRDIKIQDSTLELTANTTSGRNIQFNTLNKLELSNTDIKGNTGASSQFILTAKDAANLTEVNFSNIDIKVSNNTLMSGGGWNSSSQFTVPDGKQLKLGIGNNKINNAGSLILGNIGAVAFVNGMTSDIIKPLNLTLTKGSSSNKVTIGSDYGRNIGYADSKASEEVVVAGKYQNLGSGQSNLEYTANQTAGSIPNLSSLTYAFDGDNTIHIEAQATDVIDEENVQLTVRDKYSGNAILNTINFTIMAAGPGQATVTVDKTVIKHTVTFVDYDGTELKTQIVREGSSAQAPASPSREGYIFQGWDKDFTSITSDLTVMAQYTKIAPLQHTVTFKYFYGRTVISAPQVVERGKSATAPTNTFRIGYTFGGWDKAFNNVTSDLTVNAVYTKDNSLTLHLDASLITGLSNGDNVSQWRDQSDNGNNFAQSGNNRPSYRTSAINNLPAVRFDGTNDYMTGNRWSSYATSTAYTVFVVGKATNVNTNSDRGDRNDGFWGDTGGNVAQFLRSSSRVGTLNYDGTNDKIEQAYTVGTWKVFTSSLGSGYISIKQNGTAASTASSGNTDSLNNSLELGRVYSSFYGNQLCLDGDIAEMIIYNRSLSTAERDAVEMYLVTKYGLN